MEKKNRVDIKQYFTKQKPYGDLSKIDLLIIFKQILDNNYNKSNF